MVLTLDRRLFPVCSCTRACVSEVWHERSSWNLTMLNSHVQTARSYLTNNTIPRERMVDMLWKVKGMSRTSSRIEGKLPAVRYPHPGVRCSRPHT